MKFVHFLLSLCGWHRDTATVWPIKFAFNEIRFVLFFVRVKLKPCPRYVIVNCWTCRIKNCCKRVVCLILFFFFFPSFWLFLIPFCRLDNLYEMFAIDIRRVGMWFWWNVNESARMGRGSQVDWAASFLVVANLIAVIAVSRWKTTGIWSQIPKFPILFDVMDSTCFFKLAPKLLKSTPSSSSQKTHTHNGPLHIRLLQPTETHNWRGTHKPYAVRTTVARFKSIANH